MKAALALAAVLVATGCSSVGASAVRTGPLRLPPHVGPVAVYAGGLQPVGTDLGVVEVHAYQDEATIETLLPVFVAKVAQLGGTAAVIDDMRAVFDLVTRSHVETYSYACGYGAVCFGSRSFPMTDEVMTVTMRGRAIRMDASAAPGGKP
jgi:hypothetical protein